MSATKTRRKTRFVISRVDPTSVPRPYTMYLAAHPWGSGFCTTQLERAATFKTEKEAADERDWFAAKHPSFVYRVEEVR
jgi:hypothetical protein